VVWHGPAMKTIKMVGVLVAAAVLLAVPASSASADRYWNKALKCDQTDMDGRDIPTRYGNGDLGWSHFSGKHNIKTCRVINAALSGRVDVKHGGRLEYFGIALDNNHRQVTIVVIAQYSRRTPDGEYDAGKGNKIGVITAYCKGTTKCPNWVNG